jgi:hypothetical protein
MNLKNGRCLIVGLLCTAPGLYPITLGERVNDLVHRGKLAACRIYDGVRYPTQEKRGINKKFSDIRRYRLNLERYFKHTDIYKEHIADTIKDYDACLAAIRTSRRGHRSLANNKKLGRRIEVAEKDIQMYKQEFENYNMQNMPPSVAPLE